MSDLAKVTGQVMNTWEPEPLKGIEELTAENNFLQAGWKAVSEMNVSLAAENNRLILLLAEIANYSIDMGDYYHVRSDLIEQAEKATEER